MSHYFPFHPHDIISDPVPLFSLESGILPKCTFYNENQIAITTKIMEKKKIMFLQKNKQLNIAA